MHQIRGYIHRGRERERDWGLPSRGGTKRREDSQSILACLPSRTLPAGCGLPLVAAAADAVRPDEHGAPHVRQQHEPPLHRVVVSRDVPL
jgi:hypothetical protein